MLSTDYVEHFPIIIGEETGYNYAQEKNENSVSHL